MANSVITKVTGTDSSSNRIASTFYGTCSTGASTAAKAVTLSDSCVFTDSCLVTGATIHVKFTNSNTHATPTLKVGTATAKQIMAYGTTKAGTTSYTSWYAGAVVSFTYDGTYWQMNDYVAGVDVSTKMDKANPTGTGSFSLNRKANTTVGTNSVAVGVETTASGNYSVAEGSGTTASGGYSHAEGYYTIAKGSIQHAGGKYNIEDNNDTYAEIIGNGTANDARSNARTLDWNGNEVLSGTIEATGFGTVLDREVDRGGVQLTQAEYDALVQAGTVDANTTYFITDRNNASSSYAAGIVYDNTSSGLDSTNVQTAIDELASTKSKIISAGDVITIPQIYCAGLSYSGNTVQFTIPLPNRVSEQVTTATITAGGNICIYGSTGVLLNGALPTPTIAIKYVVGALTVTVTTSFSTSNNNRPAVVWFPNGSYITFSDT